MKMKNIVVTGMGVLSTAGFTLEAFWNSLRNSIISYGIIEEIVDNLNYRIKIGAKICSSNWADNVPDNIMSKYGKSACYTVSTAHRALEDAELDIKQIDKKRIAIIIGTTMGEIEVEEEITRLICTSSQVNSSLYQRYATENIANAIQESLDIDGIKYVIPAACAAGNYAVSIAKNLLEWNYADIAIVGGVDTFSYVAFAGFQRLLSLTPDICRPFDKNRKGLVLGEGCGILIMEREYERNNQKKYGKVIGTGLASNAYHMTAPHFDGTGESSSIIKALKDADRSINDIDYISAHGTGTKLNDKMEAKVINHLFSRNPPPISSIKSMIGHSMGAASILEIIASFLMLRNNIILPTMNYEMPDKECQLDVVANKPRHKKINNILSNAFAFGGQTSSVVIGR